jgi:hypothetical protein
LAIEGAAFGKPQRIFAAATSGDVSLPEREWNHKGRQEQKQVKRASNKMRFNGGVDALFHFARAMVEQAAFTPIASRKSRLFVAGRFWTLTRAR